MLSIKPKPIFNFRLSYTNLLSKAFWCFLIALCASSCIVIPVPTKPKIIEGKNITDANLEFLQSENVSKQDILENLGPATLWLEDQRTLVYGLRRIKKTGTMVIAGGYYSGNMMTVKSETKEALFFVLDQNDTMKHWGRSSVGKDKTWLSGASEWAESKGIELPKPSSTFVEISTTPEQSYIYFYRPRDYQYHIASSKPAKKLPAGIARFVNISLSNQLVGQLRWQTYIKIRIAPGSYTFIVDPDTDYIVNPNLYRSASISINPEPGSMTFVEVGVEAGHGIIEPKLSQRTHTEAFEVIKELKESW